MSEFRQFPARPGQNGGKLHATLPKAPGTEIKNHGRFPFTVFIRLTALGAY